MWTHLPRRVVVVIVALTNVVFWSPAGAHAAEAPASSPAANASVTLAVQLLRRLPPGNTVFSPQSISAALAMTGTGARGATAQQIARLLGLRSPAEFDAIGALDRTLLAEQRSRGSQAPTLKIADNLFLQRGFPTLGPFLTGLRERFAATPQLVDFANDPSAAARAINEWANKHTEGLIPSIVGRLSSRLRMVLANAIYLKAQWEAEFNQGDTKPGAFHGTRTASVPFMHAEESLPYATGAGYAAVELPYRSSTLGLLVLLPSTGSAVSLQRRLTPALLAGIAKRLRRRPVALALPRFALSLTTNLDAPLEALGMTKAFAPGADLSGITKAERLRVGTVLHAAKIQVNEEGTLAAAVTLVMLEALGRSIPRNLVFFDANRPFLFFLRDDRTGAILFAGRLADAASAPAPSPPS